MTMLALESPRPTAPATPGTATPLTLQDLVARPDAHRYELVEGQLVEIEPMDLIAATVAARILWLLGNFVYPRRLGWVASSDVGLAIFDDINFRKADGSFVSMQTMPVLVNGPLKVAPDLVIEVLSPTNRIGEIRDKVRRYLQAGVRDVWLVDPEERSVVSYATGRRPRSFYGEEPITSDVLPGFSQTIAEFFPTVGPL